jgi:hypothetical protein
MPWRLMGEQRYSFTMGVSGQLHALAALPPGIKRSGIHCVRGWLGSRDSLDVVEKREISCPCRESKPGRILVAIPTALSRPTLSALYFTESCQYRVSVSNGCDPIWGQYRHLPAARGSVVGWGTTLQVGWSRVRFSMSLLDFLTDLILPAALWPWGWLSL